MRALKQIIEVPANRELHIQLPAEAVAHEKAEVIILFQSAPQNLPDKLTVMREAMNDPLFLADLNEVAEDFRHIDAEAE
jgi:hypothetical protein